MSGHSKWHNIQKKKGAVDAKRAQVFTKLAKAITIAAKAGGGCDPEFNFQLRVAIDAAKAANVPKDNIERAIKRGAGESGGEEQIDEVIYEGFGPGGAALLIQCFTDNRNRSISEVRNIMNKQGGNLGNQGAVMWMFEQKGVMVVKEEDLPKDRDAFEMLLIESGVSEIESLDGAVQILCSVSDFKSVLDALVGIGITPEAAGLEYVPKDPIVVEGEAKSDLEALMEALDELDDVDTVFTNERTL